MLVVVRATTATATTTTGTTTVDSNQGAGHYTGGVAGFWSWPTLFCWLLLLLLLLARPLPTQDVDGLKMPRLEATDDDLWDLDDEVDELDGIAGFVLLCFYVNPSSKQMLM